MESDRNALKKSKKRGLYRKCRRTKGKAITVSELIRSLISKIPEGNKYCQFANRAQKLQFIIRYVTYLETTIDQVLREKNLFLDADYKILTKNKDYSKTCNHQLPNGLDISLDETSPRPNTNKSSLISDSE